MRSWLFISTVFLLCVLFSCHEKKKASYAFSVLKSDRTGLNFANQLNSTDSFNLFKYMYFYNGAGVGAGDFNNDGLIDVFFASNQGQNSLYLNKGNVQFRNVTSEAGIPDGNAWSTGVSVTDINNDGLLDIYICRVGNFRILHSRNQFLICTGIDKDGVPHYIDEAAKLGLDFSGFGTQAAFLDYDRDGDLDMFLLNHSVHENGNFRPRHVFDGTVHPTAGNRLFRNDGEKFTDVSVGSGISSTAIGYGLGIVASDINLDGYPDLYIGNDFHENDYLYINQRNGTFRDISDSALMHTSRYSMGVDIADANNDGLPEIFSADMLPSDPAVLKRTPGEESYDVFNMKISYGYSYQYSRNALQYNRGNGLFSEIALYSGVAATDWSWAPLWMDFDNDGLKDLFISNGIPKRLNDIDYINYVSDRSIQEQIRENRLDEKDRVLIDKFPEVKIPNKFFLNAGDLKFNDLAGSIEGDMNTYSNGAASADFDNDGDLDVIVNNIDNDALLYINHSNDNAQSPFLKVKLTGPEKNRLATGSKLVVYAKNGTRIYEKYPVHGFLSSMEVPLHAGLKNTQADSLVVIWPDNSFEKLDYRQGAEEIKVAYHEGLPVFDYSSLHKANDLDTVPAKDLAGEVNLQFHHHENSFPEFNREPLIPHMISTEGPAVAVGDFDGNGLDDVFFGSAKGSRRELYIQEADGKFTSLRIPALAADSNYEDVDAAWADVNSDGNLDLIVISGGNEYYNNDRHLLPRLYLNDGKANLTPKADAFKGIGETLGTVAVNDFNGDGHVDLFIGGRAVPWQYGVIPDSYLLQNDGTGRFTNVTDRYSKELGKAGFVTGSVWTDIDNDGLKDLIVCSEWGTIDAYLAKGSRLVKQQLIQQTGWWNFILPVDVNGDGLIDLVAGNLGLNSRLHASADKPVKMYYSDFDENGTSEQMLTYYLQDKELPFYNKSEMDRQMPEMRKRFLYAKDFATASLDEIIAGKKLKAAKMYTADYFASALLVNKGDMRFDMQALPWELQVSSLRDGVVTDANNDSLPDVFLVGNYYENNIEMGRYDADFGSLLLNNGRGRFTYSMPEGVAIKGQPRRVRKIKIGGRDAFIIGRNNDNSMVIRFEK